MALEWIDLRRGEGVSTLEASKPDALTVIGEIPHGMDIAPRSVAAARKLVAWLERWIERQEVS